MLVGTIYFWRQDGACKHDLATLAFRRDANVEAEMGVRILNAALDMFGFDERS